MTVTVKPLIPSRNAESSQTTQYTATNATAIIDKFTATNYSGGAVTLSINIVTAAGSASDTNLVVKLKSLAAGETYTFPEVVGHVLAASGFISTIASAASSINIRCSGREIT